MHLFGGAENIIKASLNNKQLKVSNALVDLQHNDFLEKQLEKSPLCKRSVSTEICEKCFLTEMSKFI